MRDWDSKEALEGYMWSDEIWLAYLCLNSRAEKRVRKHLKFSKGDLGGGKQRYRHRVNIGLNIFIS